jgi:hypothetical protein
MARFWTFVGSACALVAVSVSWTSAAPAGPTGVAAMGDSLVDEYRFAVEPPGRANGVARNFVEILAERRPRDLDFGAYSTTGRGEPRLKGYEYNWGREELATTSGDLLSQGQHTGAAGQAASGQVRLGILVVGSNDFRGVFLSADPVAALSDPGLVPGILTNVATATQTFLAASPDSRIVVANIPDVTRVPRLRAVLDANPAYAPLFGAVEHVIDVYNENLAATFAGNDRVAVADLNGLFDDILSPDRFKVGGLEIDRGQYGAEPDRLFVDDLHPGTVGQALMANLFLDAANDRFGLGVRRLNNGEIMRAAGAAPAVAAVPVPEAGWAALFAAPLVVLAVRRRRQAA